MKAVLAVALAAAPLTGAAAQAMPVAEFLSRADALQKKGPLALLSGDVKRLKNEVTASGRQLRQEQKAAQAAGRKPATCIPDKASVNSNELLTHFRAIPSAQRGVSVKAAFASLMRKKYPCPA
jgi:hypothetical protein